MLHYAPAAGSGQIKMLSRSPGVYGAARAAAQQQLLLPLVCMRPKPQQNQDIWLTLQLFVLAAPGRPQQVGNAHKLLLPLVSMCAIPQTIRVYVS
jgi:hypothetical protein